MILPPARPPSEPPPPEGPPADPPTDEPPSPAVLLVAGLYTVTAGIWIAADGLGTEGATRVFVLVCGLVLVGLSPLWFRGSWRGFRRR